MQKGPEIRMVGGASPEKKEAERNKILHAFSNHSESLLPQERILAAKFEYPKSEKEVALINFANEVTSQLMKEAGVEPYDVPLENFHIIPPELYKMAEGAHGTASTSNMKQRILFDASHFRNNPLNFGLIVFHELLHLKAHFSVEVREENAEVYTTPYREGVGVRSLQRDGFHGNYHQHLDGLHEAIVAETERMFFKTLIEHPELKEQKEWMSSEEAKKRRKYLAQKKNVPEEDIFWVGKDAEDDWEVVSYITQRAVLNYVCTEIQKQFADKYQSADDVYKVFLNAHFTGKLMEIGRLVEKTFGEGSFRLLGNMGTDKESGVLHLEALKRARARQLRASKNT